MRLSPFLVLAIAWATVLPPQVAAEDSNPYDPLVDVPAPLAAAIRQYGRDANRWAYTQHSLEFDRKGQPDDERLVRYDPSQHYDVQWTLLQENGKAATERQVGKYRRQKAKQAKNRKTLGELLDLKRAVLAEETGDELVYEVPLLLENNDRLPPEKFQVYVRIDRATESLRLIDVKLRSSFRVVGIVKVKSGEAQIQFARVLPEFGPTVTAIAADGRASVLFVPVGGRMAMTRADFKRVTPYDERFEVKLGPLKALDF